MVFQEHLRGEIRLTREIRCGWFWFFFPDESKYFYTVLKEVKARAVRVVWVSVLEGQALIPVGREREKARESNSLWMEVQRTEGSGAVMWGICPEIYYLSLLTF